LPKNDEIPAQHSEREAGHNLIEPECHDQPSKHGPKQHACAGGYGESAPNRTSCDRCCKSRDRADEHRPFKAEVENAGSFGNKFTQSRQQ